MSRNTLIAAIGILILIFLLPSPLQGAIQLPSVIGDHMVLQQQSFPSLWGRARPGERIVVIPSWDREAPTVAYADSKGRWRIPIVTPAAGGPYEILVQSQESRILLRDVWIGEVWLLAGGGALAPRVADTPNELTPFDFSPQVRLFRVGIDHASTPRSDCAGAWGTLNNAERLGAAGLLATQLAQSLYDSLGVPIGIIESSQEQTPIASWVRREVFESKASLAPPLLSFQAALRDFRTNPDQPNPAESSILATTSFNAMIAPLIPFEIAGVYWGQSLVDSAHPYRYAALFPAMVSDLQRQWGYSFPLYLVESGPVTKGEANWGLRLAGQQLFRMRGAGIIPYSNSARIVRQMVEMALSGHYQWNGLPLPAAVLDQVSPQGDSLKLAFRPRETQLTPSGEGLNSLQAYVPERGRFLPAQAVFEGNTADVFIPGQKITAVRYKPQSADQASWVNQDGVPILPFRTDTFPTFWHRPDLSIKYEKGKNRYVLNLPEDPILPYSFRIASSNQSPEPNSPILPATSYYEGPDTLVIQAFQGKEKAAWQTRLALLQHPGQMARLESIDTRPPKLAILQDGLPAVEGQPSFKLPKTMELQYRWDERLESRGFRLHLPEGVQAQGQLGVQVWGSRNNRKEKLLGSWIFKTDSEAVPFWEGLWNATSYRSIRMVCTWNGREVPLEITEWEILKPLSVP